ncbi:hypothetical protein Tco_0131722, partial [Tanacetum coccineum]
YRQNITCWNCNQKGNFQNQCSKLVASRDKEVSMTARDSDDALKVTKGSLVVALGNKRGSLYMVEVHPEGIGAIIDGSGSAALWFGEAEEFFLHNVREDKETTEVGASSYRRL